MNEFFALKKMLYALYFIILLCPFGIPIIFLSRHIIKKLIRKENFYGDQDS
tara:strand:+ start:569 stop:721 length:153 start_codon:yes stop_codon:yes gene_type:complete